MTLLPYPPQPLKAALISGGAWAFIGLLLLFIMEPHLDKFDQTIEFARCGMLAAPLIGILMGYASALFVRFGTLGRIVLAGATLYLASLLFVMAAMGLNLLTRTRPGTPGFEEFMTASAMAAFAGLTLTWAFVVLWPLAYVNHRWVGGLWPRPEAAD